jgi:hypothetical protein
MSTLTARRGLLTLAVASALLVGSFAVASSASASTLYACVKKSGSAHVFAKKPKCKKGETKLSWNSNGAAGKNGTNGANGSNGANGTNGKEGAAGQPQKAASFSSSATGAGPTVTTLASLGGVTIRTECISFLGAAILELEAAAPAGSRAETGVLALNTAGTAPEVAQENLINDVALTPAFAKIGKLTGNLKAPFGNVAHLTGSITTASGVVFIDLFEEALSPGTCTVRGSAFAIPE